jgi:thiamine-phosphate pyrophosphorylase
MGLMSDDDSPRLYLMLPDGLSPVETARLLLAAFEGGEIACVLAPVAPDEASSRKMIEACLPLCEKAGAALLLRDAALAKATGCDGAHLDLRNLEVEKALASAAKTLKPKFSLGAGGLRNRHAAMEAGECDVDYVMFGEPSPDGFVPPVEQTLERAQWWAEIFNVPCVAYAAGIDDVAMLAKAGADFIALRDAVWHHSEGAAAAVRNAQLRIAEAPARATMRADQ